MLDMLFTERGSEPPGEMLLRIDNAGREGVSSFKLTIIKATGTCHTRLAVTNRVNKDAAAGDHACTLGNSGIFGLISRAHDTSPLASPLPARMLILSNRERTSRVIRFMLSFGYYRAKKAAKDSSNSLLSRMRSVHCDLLRFRLGMVAGLLAGAAKTTRANVPGAIQPIRYNGRGTCRIVPNRRYSRTIAAADGIA